jgi:hypothetical protein
VRDRRSRRPARRLIPAPAGAPSDFRAGFSHGISTRAAASSPRPADIFSSILRVFRERPKTCLKVLKFQHFSSKNAPFQIDKTLRFSYNDRGHKVESGRVAPCRSSFKTPPRIAGPANVNGIVRLFPKQPRVLLLKFERENGDEKNNF